MLNCLPVRKLLYFQISSSVRNTSKSLQILFIYEAKFASASIQNQCRLSENLMQFCLESANFSSSVYQSVCC